MTKQKEITQEMVDDLSRMGDKDWATKYGTFRQYPIRLRKRLGIPSYNLQHGLREHRFENGEEYKYCSQGGGHWDVVANFGKANNRWDGLRGICRKHEIEMTRESYYLTGKKKIQNDKWKLTPEGRKSLRNTWRKQTAKKNDAYILWLPEHEQRAYDHFGGRCAYCGTPVDFLKVEFDHFIPIREGGKTHPNNMLPCCKKCNHGTGGKFTVDARTWLVAKFGETRGMWVYSYCTTALYYLGDEKYCPLP